MTKEKKDELLTEIAYSNILYGEMWHMEQEIGRMEREDNDAGRLEHYNLYVIKKKYYDEQQEKLKNLIGKL